MTNPLASVTRPLALIAHDAGAANILLAWLAALRHPGLTRAVMSGPAAMLWSQRFGDGVALACSVEEAVEGAATLVSGTGWASSIEHRARIIARERGIHSIAVVDHWTNYRARFERDGVTVLPDRVWVTDDHALGLARQTVPECMSECYSNFYLAEQAHAAGPCPADGHLLFVAEPARDDWGRGQAGEFQALDYLVRNGCLLGVPPGTRHVLRPHPSDEIGKYDAWLERHPGWELDNADNLADALRASLWVAGLQSYALVVAMESGRKAVSALPPWAPECALPNQAIIHLKQCVADRALHDGRVGEYR